MVETLNCVKGSYDIVKKMHQQLYAENKVVQLNNDDYLESLDISTWFGNSINYSDCTILNTMMNMGINTIVSFDNDFKKFGLLEVIYTI